MIRCQTPATTDENLWRMSASQTTTVDTKTLIEGFESARARFDESAPGSAHEFHAIFEVLAWPGAIKDRFDAEKKHVPDVLAGLWLVRNQALHRGAEIAAWTMAPGSIMRAAHTSQVILPPGKRSLTWPARSAFMARSNARGAAEYDARIAGRGITEVFNDVRSALR
jgi:hypothetical protein